MGESGRIIWKFLFLLVLVGSCVNALEHNLPDGVELVDPKDLGLDSQFDLDKLLGNVKALPIDTNGISSALGKPGLKTQVLTVGFDGSEGLNLDDFELPQMKNDEHGPLAQEAFKSFKNFFKNSSSASQVDDNGSVPAGSIALAQQQAPQTPQVVRSGGKRRTMMKRRKVVRVNGTATTTPSPPATGPKVIELDSSQIEKLIASGKIGPPKSLTPGGPQVIELGQSDLDALLNGENGDEIKQILEGGESIKDFDLSQISRGTTEKSLPQSAPVVRQPQILETTTTTTTTNRINESRPPLSIAQIVNQVSSPIPTVTTTSTYTAPVTYSEESPVTVVTTPVATSTAPPTPSTTTGHPIIYQYSSLNDEARHARIPPQGVHGSIPLQFYSSHANGHQVAKQIKTPTFEFISAPPVSFSSSILPSNVQAQYQQQNQQPVYVQPQFQNSFIPQNPPQYVVASQPAYDSNPPNQPQKQGDIFNKLIPAPQTSSHTEEVKPSISDNVVPNTNSGNYIQSLHKVNLPENSVKLASPSPQVLHSVLNQVPTSFQPAIMPSHVVNSPVLDPFRLNQQQNNFLRASPQQQQNEAVEPFRNTQLFSPAVAPATRPPSSQSQVVRTPNSFVRFPTTSNILASPPSRFRTAESSNPYYQQNAGGFGNLVLNSFIAGDGLNYRPRSHDNFQAPGI